MGLTVKRLLQGKSEWHWYAISCGQDEKSGASDWREDDEASELPGRFRTLDLDLFGLLFRLYRLSRPMMRMGKALYIKPPVDRLKSSDEN